MNVHTPLGTAQWTDPIEVADRYPYADGKLWLGRSAPGGDIPLGFEDDRHVCLVSGSRAGKGTTTIIPNLCLWPGSLVVVDPKGENATVTAARRGPGSEHCEGLGQDVHVLDPFGVAKIDDALRSRFNPLDAIDPTSEETPDEAGRIAAAIVVENPEAKDRYWDESARSMLKGILLHVLTSAEFEDKRNLITVRKLVTHGDWQAVEALEAMGEKDVPTGHELLWQGLASNPAFDGIVSGIGTTFRNLALKAAKQHESVLQTLNRNTEFIDSPGMRRCLEASDFRLSDLKTAQNGVSIYLSLPQRYMTEHFRWLRMMISLTVTELEAVPGQPACGHRVLMCLDEFAGLKHMEVLENAVAQMAGFGLKLFFVLQSLEQLKGTYKDHWETFLANSGLKIFYGVEDHFTREYVSKLVGETEVIRTTHSQSDTAGESASHTEGTSQSHTEGRSKSFTEGESESHAEGESRSSSRGRSRSRSKSRSEGRADSRNESATASTSQSGSQSTNESTSRSRSKTHGRNAGTNESRGDSSGSSFGWQNFSLNSSRSRNRGHSEGWNTSDTAGASSSRGRGSSITKGSGSSKTAGRGSSRNWGVSASETEGHTDTETHGSNRSHTRGRSRSTTHGQSHSETHGSSHSETRGQSRSATAGQSESVHKRALISPDEVGQAFRRIDDPLHPDYPGLGLVLLAGAYPIVVQRVNYFQEHLLARKFDPHPDHKALSSDWTIRLDVPERKVLEFIIPKTKRWRYERHVGTGDWVQKNAPLATLHFSHRLPFSLSRSVPARVELPSPVQGMVRRWEIDPDGTDGADVDGLRLVLSSKDPEPNLRDYEHPVWSLSYEMKGVLLRQNRFVFMTMLVACAVIVLTGVVSCGAALSGVKGSGIIAIGSYVALLAVVGLVSRLYGVRMEARLKEWDRRG